jgi:cytochrome c oxidase subunit 4
MLAGNIGLAFAGLGPLAPAAHLLVAAAMAFIVLAVFMELDCGASLCWVFAGAGFLWLWILFFLTAADYLTRYSYAPA